MRLSDIERTVRAEYNEHISVFDYGTFIRITNGSAAHAVDIRIQDGRVQLRGENYGDVIDEECDPNPEAVLDTLARAI